MKFEINGYEVNISVKGKWDEKANKETTMHFMNEMSIYCTEAAYRYQNIGMEGLERTARKIGNEIFKRLENEGLYKDL